METLTMGFRTTALPLFIDFHTSVKVQKDQIFNLILSPSFYWVKHVSIPVKNLHEVNRFLPSLFEDTVPEGKYSYYAYKDEDAYIIFAYDDKKILDILSEKEIRPEQINNVYFAQSEFEDSSEAISIDEDSVLDIDNNIVVKLPKSFVDSSTPLQLHHHNFSRHTITLARYAHIATTKSLIRFILFMGALISIFTLDWIVTEAKISEFDDTPLELYTEHNLPATKVQNEVIFETLQKQYKQQMKLRQKAGEVLKLKLNKSEHVNIFELGDKKLKLEIKLDSSKRASDVSTILQKKEAPKDQYKNGKLKLEF